MNISILGNGIWGSTLANYFKNLGHKIYIDTINDSEVIFVCVPAEAVVPCLLNFKEKIKNQKIVICSKGLNSDGQLLSEAIKKEINNDLFFFYGPSLAEEVKNKELTGIILAGGIGKEDLKKQFESENLVIELSDDIIGVQLSSTLKNIVTLFLGIAEGYGLKQNTQAFIFTKGIQEIKKIGDILGAKSETFLGLSCIGDAFLKSRNYSFGIQIGKGKKLEEALKETNYVVEGIETLKNIKILTKKIEIQTPFIDTLYSILFENLNIKEALYKLK